MDRGEQRARRGKGSVCSARAEEKAAFAAARAEDKAAFAASRAEDKEAQQALLATVERSMRRTDHYANGLARLNLLWGALKPSVVLQQPPAAPPRRGGGGGGPRTAR